MALTALNRASSRWNRPTMIRSPNNYQPPPPPLTVIPLTSVLGLHLSDVQLAVITPVMINASSGRLEMVSQVPVSSFTTLFEAQAVAPLIGDVLMERYNFR